MENIFHDNIWARLMVPIPATAESVPFAIMILIFLEMGLIKRLQRLSYDW